MYKLLWQAPEKALQQEKKTWMDYVPWFVEKNKDIPEDHFGRWIDILIKEIKCKDKF